MEKTIDTSRAGTAPLVSVVDDDDSMREALESLLKSIGFRVAVFASARSFLAAGDVPRRADCLILDVRMPEMNGLELQAQLLAENYAVPIVFVSAHSERDEKETALARGAIDFLQKPFDEESLLGAVRAAVAAKDEINTRE